MKKFLAMLLALIMMLSLVACGGAPAEEGSADVAMQYITVDEAKALVESDEYVFFDVRKAADAATNSIVGAQSWDMDAAKEGDAEAGKATMTEATKGLDKKIIVVCYSGKRYAQATTNALSAIGYDMSKVYTLEGGFTKWSETYPELTTAGEAVEAPVVEKKPEDYTGNLVIYSPHDPSPLEAGVSMFMKKYPNINVEYLSIPTGEAIQRIAAESENPQCDVLWGGGADTLAGKVDLFQAFVSVHDDVIGDAYKDANDMWIGESPLPMVFIYNKTLIAEEDVPTTWEGLTDPALKGKIAYANPAKSGSAYTQLCTMLFSQPTLDEGWALVDKFIDNLDGKLQDGSSACHKYVASGEYVIGVTLEKSAVLYADNPDIGFIYPEKNSAVPDGISLVKNCPNQENAELFINYMLSLEVQQDQNVSWKRRPVRSDLTPEGLCELSTLDLGDYDFEYAATEKESIIEKWNDLTVD